MIVPKLTHTCSCGHFCIARSGIAKSGDLPVMPRLRPDPGMEEFVDTLPPNRLLHDLHNKHMKAFLQDQRGSQLMKCQVS